MKIINPRNLPDVLVKAVTEDVRIFDENRISVTELIDSPLKRHLRSKHGSDLTVEVEDMTWKMVGKAFHLMMEKYATKGSIFEKKIEMQVDGTTIVGIPDLHCEEILYDFKVTSVYSFILGENISWERQLNIYRLMLNSIGIETKEIKIIAVLKDFNMRKASEEGYPKRPLIAVDIPMWTLDDTMKYIRERISAHKNLQPCTEEERWTRPTTYAVKVKGVNKAKRVLSSYDEACAWLANSNLKGAYIEKREGEDSKCLRYCDYAKYCQYNRYNQ